MILTPRMWTIKQRIDFLEQVCCTDPNDFISRFELDELKIEFDKLGRRERIGLKPVYGGLHSSKASTKNNHQTA